MITHWCSLDYIHAVRDFCSFRAVVVDVALEAEVGCQVAYISRYANTKAIGRQLSSLKRIKYARFYIKYIQQQKNGLSKYFAKNINSYVTDICSARIQDKRELQSLINQKPLGCPK